MVDVDTPTGRDVEMTTGRDVEMTTGRDDVEKKTGRDVEDMKTGRDVDMKTGGDMKWQEMIELNGKGLRGLDVEGRAIEVTAVRTIETCTAMDMGHHRIEMPVQQGIGKANNIYTNYGFQRNSVSDWLTLKDRARHDDIKGYLDEQHGKISSALSVLHLFLLRLN